MFHVLILLAFSITIAFLNLKSKNGRTILVFNRIPTLLAVVGLVVVFPMGSAVGTVPAGDTGVVTQFGAVQMGDLKTEGIYFVTPGVQQVHVMDTKPHKIEINDAEAVTSDR